MPFFTKIFSSICVAFSKPAITFILNPRIITVTDKVRKKLVISNNNLNEQTF